MLQFIVWFLEKIQCHRDVLEATALVVTGFGLWRETEAQNIWDPQEIWPEFAVYGRELLRR